MRYAILAMILIAPILFAADDRVIVGSKAFGESWILAESVRMTLQDAGVRTEHKRNLGGTQIAFEVLAVHYDSDIFPQGFGRLCSHRLQRNVDGLGQVFSLVFGGRKDFHQLGAALRN